MILDCLVVSDDIAVHLSTKIPLGYRVFNRKKLTISSTLRRLFLRYGLGYLRKRILQNMSLWVQCGGFGIGEHSWDALPPFHISTATGVNQHLDTTLLLSAFPPDIFANVTLLHLTADHILCAAEHQNPAFLNFVEALNNVEVLVVWETISLSFFKYFTAKFIPFPRLRVIKSEDGIILALTPEDMKTLRKSSREWPILPSEKMFRCPLRSFGHES